MSAGVFPDFPAGRSQLGPVLLLRTQLPAEGRQKCADIKTRGFLAPGSDAMAALDWKVVRRRKSSDGSPSST